MKKAVLFLVVMMLLSGCVSERAVDNTILETDPTDETKQLVDSVISVQKPTENSVNIKDQVEVDLVDYVLDGDNYAGAFIKNGSDKTIGEMKIQILFYDVSGNILGIAEDGHDVVLPGSTVVSFFQSYDVPSEYDHMDYKLSLDVDTNTRYKNHAANIEIETNIGEECVILQITNNTNVVIEELEYVVVFYKDGEVVYSGWAEDVYDIPAGETVFEEYECRGVDYDTYEVYLNQAHTF